MPQRYTTLPSRPLAAGTPVYRHSEGRARPTGMDDPAVNVMTDLKQVKAVTEAPETLIDEALQKMIHAEVRLLIVTDAHATVLGIITARDLMGERPVAVSSRERVPHREIRVEQVMSPREELSGLDLKEVQRKRVGDIVVTLRDIGRQHALVLEADQSTGRDLIRGIFSVTQIGKQLGVEIEPEGKVQSFAELEQRLTAG